MTKAYGLKDAREAIEAAIRIIEDVEHGLDCPRSRDDYACTCHYSHALERLDLALDCLPKKEEYE